MNNKIKIPKKLDELLSKIPNSYLVGGFVRDQLIGIESKDYDIEVFNISYEKLAQELASHGKTDLVGKSFGVIKLRYHGMDLDFSLPRRDSKVGLSHTDFDISLEPNMSIKDAMSRRDFTINAIYYDPRRKQLIDHFNGLQDLKIGVLHYVNEKKFSEDPLRVLRAAQFIGRFSLIPSIHLIELCKSIENSFENISKERVWAEFEKLVLKAKIPSLAFYFLQDVNWLKHFPELNNLVDCPQDSTFHPEGSVWIHSLCCLNELIKLPEYQNADYKKKLILFFAVLTHDLGKPKTTKSEYIEKHGRVCITSKDHEAQGVPLAESFLKRIDAPGYVISYVKPLVGNHLAHIQEPTRRSVRRLSVRLKPASINDLISVIKSDHAGRPPLPKDPHKNVIKIREIAKELEIENSSPDQILTGKLLMANGWKPSKVFGEVIRDAYQAQLDGIIQSESDAIEWLDKQSY